MSDLSEFDVRTDASPEASVLKHEFEKFYFNVLPHLSSEQASSLMDKIMMLDLIPDYRRDAVEYGANYDLKQEIQGLIDAVKAMQDSVMINGRIRNDVTPKEMKEVVTSTTSLMNLLMKYHRELLSMDRMRALEAATVEVLQQLGDRHGEKIVSEFVKMMEDRLVSD